MLFFVQLFTVFSRFSIFIAIHHEWEPVIDLKINYIIFSIIDAYQLSLPSLSSYIFIIFSHVLFYNFICPATNQYLMSHVLSRIQSHFSVHFHNIPLFILYLFYFLFLFHFLFSSTFFPLPLPLSFLYLFHFLSSSTFFPLPLTLSLFIIYLFYFWIVFRCASDLSSYYKYVLSLDWTTYGNVSCKSSKFCAIYSISHHKVSGDIIWTFLTYNSHINYNFLQLGKSFYSMTSLSSNKQNWIELD